jgi:hypothetical protein
MARPIFIGWRRIFCCVIAEFERCDLIDDNALTTDTHNVRLPPSRLALRRARKAGHYDCPRGSG